ncbi:MAG: hypothetical protein HY687_03280 [Chloroflexi bacterium]|nr:hypothetical protein [Chloroflexota bacterium]
MQEKCVVCQQPVDEVNVARCTYCGKHFHLAWSVDSPIENCGRPLIDDTSQSMVFICNRCQELLERQRAMEEEFRERRDRELKGGGGTNDR